VQAFTAEEHMTLCTSPCVPYFTFPNIHACSLCADTVIYNMCTQKIPNDYSEELYARYRKVFVTYLKTYVVPTLKRHRGETFLRHLLDGWTKHGIMVRWLRRFFQYLDRFHIQRHHLPTLAEVGVMAFRETAYPCAKKKACDAIIQQIDAERDGESVDAGLLRAVLGMFQEVGMGSLQRYDADFEQEFLNRTGIYYRRMAAEWIDALDVAEYLAKVEACLKMEEDRVRRYLHVSTLPKLLAEVERQLLQEYHMRLVEDEKSGCAALLRDERTDDLARMYRLFSRLPNGLDPLAVAFRRHVEADGLKLVAKAGEAAAEAKARKGGGEGRTAPEHAFIRNVVALHDSYMVYLTNCFGRSAAFHRALKDAFESFCNKRVAGASAAELTATFCDTLLKKGHGERLSEDELEVMLEKVVQLLAYVSDKDLFYEFYRKRLSRRLLGNLSVGEDAEKSVLNQLKRQCGQQFTSKLEGMVQDFQLAREKERAFQEWLERCGIQLPTEIAVTVLTTGFWPNYKPLEIQLPECLAAGVQAFGAFHDETTQKSRRLQWQMGLGQVIMKATFDKTYELIVVPSQAVILMALDDVDTMSFGEVRVQTGLPEDDLRRALQSLCLGKYRLLRKIPETPDTIATTDMFAVNENFSDRARRLRVQLPPVDDRRVVQGEVAKDRKHALEAAIVRIMKARKKLDHSTLIMEVVQQSQRTFQPDVRQIKRCIEGLIEREYLERDEENPQIYKYIA